MENHHQPIAPLAREASGFGADLGESVSLSELATRYANLRARLPSQFAGLAPLIRFADDPTDLNARLIAGPFADKAIADDFCRVIRLQMGRPCETAAYSGDALRLRSDQ